MRMKRAKREEKSKQEKEQKDKTKKIKRGPEALKEIKKYQSNMEMLIRRLPFQRVVKEIVQKVQEDLRLAIYCNISIARGRANILSGSIGTV